MSDAPSPAVDAAVNKLLDAADTEVVRVRMSVVHQPTCQIEPCPRCGASHSTYAPEAVEAARHCGAELSPFRCRCGVLLVAYTPSLVTRG